MEVELREPGVAELRPPAGLDVSASVACGGCLLSASIEERTKVRSRKHGIHRDEPTCDEEKSLTSILSLSRKGEAEPSAAEVNTYSSIRGRSVNKSQVIAQSRARRES
jgi:hypothetical protein